MAEWEKICEKRDLPGPGEAIEVSAGWRQLCIANEEGDLSALDNWCPHRQAPLAQGLVEKGKIICPYHAWAFDLKTGISPTNPGASVESFPIKVEGDDVFVQLKPAE